MDPQTLENQAIRACQAGQISEFTYLYDQYVKPIYRYIYGKVYDQALSEDLTSQTFLQAMESIRSFSPRAEASIKSWLFAIARNLVIDHWRRERPQVDLEEIAELPSADDLPEAVAKTIALEKIKTEMQKLTAEQREIVTLRVWHNLSHAEIASLINKKEATVKVAYSRAVAKLAGQLANLFFLGFMMHHSR